MSGDVISALKLDKESPNGRVIVVKEMNGCEGSFIASSVLAHQVRKKCASLLITFHQLLDHYHNVGLRMGYNLKSQEATGLVKVISPADLFVHQLFNGKTEDFLNETTSLIRESLTRLVEEHGSQGSVCVYVDGLTHLFDLGYSLKLINFFASTIIQFIRDSDNIFVVFHCTAILLEDDSSVLANLLSHMSHSVVECGSLPSGRSAEVSGHMTVRHPGERFHPDRRNVVHVAHSKYHFRLFDRGVKLFAPGAVG